MFIKPLNQECHNFLDLITGHGMPKRSRKEISDPNLSAANVLKQMFNDAEADGKELRQCP
jgi:hypothetical protein